MSGYFLAGSAPQFAHNLATSWAQPGYILASATEDVRRI